MAAWSFSKMGFEAPLLFEAVARESLRKMALFNSEDLAKTVWAYSTAFAAARVRTPRGAAAPLLELHEALFEAISREAPTRLESYSPKTLAMLLWAFAESGVPAPVMYKALAGETVRRLILAKSVNRTTTFKEGDLTNIAWAYARAGVEAPALFIAIAAASLTRIESYWVENLSRTAWAFAKAGVSAPQLFKAISVEAAKKMDKCNPRVLADTAWAFSKAGVVEPVLFEAVAAEAVKTVAEFQPKDLAALAGAYAAAAFPAPALFEAVGLEAISKISKFEAKDLAHTAFAFSTAKVASPRLFEAIAAAAVKKVRLLDVDDVTQVVWAFSNAPVGTSAAPILLEVIAFNFTPEHAAALAAKDLASVASAYSTAAVESRALFDALAVEAVEKVHLFSVMELVKVASAYATKGYEAPVLFEALAAAAARKVAAFEARDLAGFVWAFSIARADAPSLFDAVALEASRRIAHFNPLELTKTVWAFASASVAAPLLFHAVAAEAPKKIMMFKPRDLANTVWAFSTARVEAPQLFEAIAAAVAASSRISTALGPQELADTAWAFAMARVEVPALLDAIAKLAPATISSFNSQDMAKIAWTFAALGIAAPSLFEAVAEKIKMNRGFGEEALAQMLHVYWHLQLTKPDVDAVEDSLSQPKPNALLALLQKNEARLKEAYLRHKPPPTEAQRDVSAALTRAGWRHEFDVVTSQGLSLAMAQSASRVCVEFDDCTKLLARPHGAGVLDGRAAFEESLLRRLGWHVVRVNVYDWDLLQSPDAQEAFLRDKLRGRGTFGDITRKAHPEAAPDEPAAAEDEVEYDGPYASMPVPQLKQLAKIRGVEMSNRRSVLLDRLAVDDEAQLM
ncbi:hypothetical protein M885DRAFT_129612 [Pelagophyceae sp. CCMP2097]|nr:hypothetical protein M885DRAFT_129612 [Pelagophyceae sp. CCMP2097]